jgi:hypothetical protein
MLYFLTSQHEVQEIVDMVDPNEFVKVMEHHWTGCLGNVSSEPLRKLWHRMAYMFGSYAVGYTHKNKWTVLQPPTGSGKTEGTMVYCSMLSVAAKDFYPGVLIVTRLKTDADHIADRINELTENMSEADKHSISVVGINAGKLPCPINKRSGIISEAVAYHGDTKGKLNTSDLKNYPVLVITHKAHELAMDSLEQDGDMRQTWPYFSNWKNSKRRLIIIDEALDIVKHSKAELDKLRQTEATLSQSMRERFSKEVQCLNEVIDVLSNYEKKTRKKTIKDHRVVDDCIKSNKAISFSGLRQAMRKETRYDLKLLCKTDNKEQQRLREIHDAIMEDLEDIVQSWVYYAHVNGQPTLNTARLIIPDYMQGAAVLDATAGRNVMYELFPPANVEPIPKDSRNYQNVTLHISRDHNLGSGYMKDKAKELSQELIDELNERLDESRKVFVCTHKDIEPALDLCKPLFDLRKGHWGAIDGSNDYRDCDTAVIFGIPYRPNILSTNIYMALQGEQTTDWLQDSTNRAHGEHQDIKKSLTNGQIITSIIQAINRVRCRKVIDAEGNCLSTDVYLMLPKNAIAEEILDSIKNDMPGIRTKDWTFSSGKRQVRGSKHESALREYIVNMDIGSQDITTIKKALNISNTSFKTLVKKMKDDSSNLYKAITKVGAKYSSEGPGKGRQAYIVKSE